MSITVACGTCRHRYTVDSTFVGRMMTCKKCGNIFRIQKASSAASGARASAARPADGEEQSEAAAPPPGPIDPFANAQFEGPAKAKPKAGAKKYYNPIETNALSPGEPEDAPVIARDPFAGRSSGGGGFNAISLYILLLLVGSAVAFGVYWSIRISRATPVAATASSALGTLWTAVGFFVAAFFALIAPLILAGVWTGFRALKYPMEKSAYLRLCGAFTPALLFAAGCQVGAIQSPLAWLLLLLLLPATYFLLKLMLDVDWAGGGVAFASGAVGFAVGFLILKVFVEMLVPADSSSPVRMAFYAPVPEPAAHGVVDSSHGSPAESARQPLFVPGPAVSSPSPDAPAIPAPTPGDQKPNPPPTIDPGIYTAAIDNGTPEWTTVVYLSGSKLGPEISFKQFKLRPPKEMRLDLQSSEESATGLVWRGATNPNMRFSVYTQPRKNMRQLKPLVGDAAVQPATEQGLFVINRTGTKVSSGQINDLSFTRIESASEVQDESLTQYVAPVDGMWLIIEIAAPNHAPFARVMAAAAGTVRQTESGEGRADPLAANLIAPRLAEDYDHVAPVLRAQGAAAEGAVLALLKRKDTAVRQAALRLLKDIATEKSVPALRRVAAESDPFVADLAREALQRFQPADVAPGPGPGPGPAPSVADKPVDLATVVADLDNNDVARRKAAVLKLPSFSPEEAQRPQVILKLTGMLRAPDNTVSIPDVVGALQVWGNAKMIPDLMPLLEKDANPDARHAAMRLLGNYKDTRAAIAVARWIILDPVPTADCLIAMGPAAEDAVIPNLRNANATVRIDASRILSRIGTRKCLTELNRAAHDPLDAAAREAAASAVESVKARIAAEMPGK